MREYQCPVCDHVIRSGGGRTLINNVGQHLEKHVKEGKMTKSQYSAIMLKDVTKEAAKHPKQKK